ncbi:MAG TPA: CBS domain-containing protein, partial [Chitinophagales bacterium]|nr:CBS domain-containing protein [Chitinophagales bacterium]
TVLQTMDTYGMGFVLVTDEEGKLEGVVSNADVRKGLLRSADDFNKVTVDNIVNSKPVSINQNATVSDIVRLVNGLSFIVLFLPVVDDSGILKGAVLLNNLTRV